MKLSAAVLASAFAMFAPVVGTIVGTLFFFYLAGVDAWAILGLASLVTWGAFFFTLATNLKNC